MPHPYLDTVAGQIEQITQDLVGGYYSQDEERFHQAVRRLNDLRELDWASHQCVRVDRTHYPAEAGRR